MSQQNVDLIRRRYEHFAKTGDPSLEQIGPEFEYHTLDTEPDAGVYKGPDGFRQLLGMWTEMFDGFAIEIDEPIDAGDYVVVPGRARGHGRGSGIEVDAPYVFVWKIQDGELLECREYPTKEEALRAVGLSK